MSGPASVQINNTTPVPVSGSVLDGNSAAFQGCVALTPGTTASAQRSVGFICTTSGNATFTFSDGSIITVPLLANPVFQTLPFAATLVTLGSGTAATFWNLK